MHAYGRILGFKFMYDIVCFCGRVHHNGHSSKSVKSIQRIPNRRRPPEQSLPSQLQLYLLRKSVRGFLVKQGMYI